MWELNGNPYEVQARALNETAEFPHGYAYFMEMGLGKTAVTLADFLRAKKKGLADILVIVAPHSLLGNWAREVKQWPKSENMLTCTIWPKKENADVYVLNYEAFAVGNATGNKFVSDLCSKFRVFLVLDESTQIKNSQSVRTRALLSLARDATFTRILSGAPMVQGPHDLWSQLKFIGELRGVNYYQYRNRYCKMGGFQGRQILGANEIRMPELHGILANCAFRAKKSDWLDIPDKIYVPRTLSLSPQYARAYEEMRKELLLEIDGQEITAPMAITLMLKLQQISSGFVISDTGVTTRISGVNNKLNTLIDIITNEIDTKVVIPVYFQESQAILIEALEANNIKFAKILSKMTPEEIENEKLSFNGDDTVKVALAQTSSQKYGHTLLGTASVPCHTTIFYENTFSLDDRLQMEDRNHRIGQRFPVTIIDLNCSSIEEKAVAALNATYDFYDVLGDGGENAFIAAVPKGSSVEDYMEEE
jgi:SNF2 family DNA or RNA helicase